MSMASLNCNRCRKYPNLPGRVRRCIYSRELRADHHLHACSNRRGRGWKSFSCSGSIDLFSFSSFLNLLFFNLFLPLLCASVVKKFHHRDTEAQRVLRCSSAAMMIACFPVTGKACVIGRNRPSAASMVGVAAIAVGISAQMFLHFKQIQV